MRAAVLHGPRDLRVQSAPAPEPGAGEALVRVTLAGLCGTDHRIFTGERPVRYPRVMGHEMVGRLAATGERVVVEPNFACGVCPLCREGNRNLCLSRTAVGIDVDGGFAELVRVPTRCCWPAPTRTCCSPSRSPSSCGR
jgi:threonine dehydrogenase-like Zn-dependent dehydrogenase